MPSKNDRTAMHERRKGNGEEEDRLSDLPDCVLTHLMTFISTKDSVRTSVLSKRWKDLWKRVPSLTLHTWDSECAYKPHFRNLARFDRFVFKFLSLRDDSVPLSLLDFIRTPIHVHNGRTSSQPLTKIVRYAASHNVEHMKLTINCDVDLQHYLLWCHSLTSLDLEGCERLFPKSLNLAVLERLRVGTFVFSGDENGGLVEPFSSCVRLKTLVIEYCYIRHSQTLCISNGALINLTICAPAISSSKVAKAKIVISTPNLFSFTYSGFANAQQLYFASNLSCLKEVNIDIRILMSSHKICQRTACILIKWLQMFGNVELMTITSCTLLVLNLIPDILNKESPCLDKLKLLIVNDRKLLSRSPPVQIPSAVVDYLIQNSSSAKVTTRTWYGW